MAPVNLAELGGELTSAAGAVTMPAIAEVVSPDGTPRAPLETAYVDDGIAVHSGDFDGLATSECKRAVVLKLQKLGRGAPRVTYRLRDRAFSRQRYWGEPIQKKTESDTTIMRYEAPESLDTAIALLAGATGDARVLAGGTDLLVQMRSDIVDPELIVDIKRIPETRSLTQEGGGWRIGAAVTGAELKENAELKKVWPGVVEAANLIGSTQIQGRATLGGNLCNGSPAADGVPALIAAGAIATVVGPRGRRDIPVEDVMIGPRTLSLQKGEIVVSFFLPPRAKGSADAYLRFIPRTEMDIAVVGSGVSLTVDGSARITAARVSLGAVAEKVLLVPEAAQAIIGTSLDRAAQQGLEAAARAACRPIDDKRGTVEFRVGVAGVLTRRAALIALERARTS